MDETVVSGEPAELPFRLPMLIAVGNVTPGVGRGFTAPHWLAVFDMRYSETAHPHVEHARAPGRRRTKGFRVLHIDYTSPNRFGSGEQNSIEDRKCQVTYLTSKNLCWEVRRDYTPTFLNKIRKMI